MVHVRHHDLELVIRIHTRHQAAFQHLGQIADGGFEVLETFRGVAVHADEHVGRSEEHTSELQSLMRISYAVFCLTKNTTTSQIPSCNCTPYSKTRRTNIKQQ